MEEVVKKTRRKGAGRPRKEVHRASMNISGTPDQLNKLRELAKASGKNTSQFILEKTGVISPK